MNPTAASLDAATLDALLAEWDVLRDRPDDPAVGALTQRFIAHRSALLADNANLQANATRDDDPVVSGRVEANVEAVKRCTVALSEMTTMQGRSFLGG